MNAESHDRPWRVQLLGGMGAERDGFAVTRFKTQKNAALFAYLALRLDRAHPREKLVTLLWPDTDPEVGRRNLSQSLFVLRGLFEPPDGEPPGEAADRARGGLFLADRSAIRLNPAAVETDVDAFEAALRDAKAAASDEERIEALTRAVERYRGELLPGFYEEWVLLESGRLAECYMGALRELTASLTAKGALDAALPCARRWVAEDRLNEEAHRQLLHLLNATGMPTAALRHFRQMERIFREELNAVPSESTQRIAAALGGAEGGAASRPDLSIETGAVPEAPGPRQPSISCSRCGTALGPAARFCPECGEPAERRCGRCRRSVSPAARFCEACGMALETPSAPRTAPALASGIDDGVLAGLSAPSSPAAPAGLPPKVRRRLLHHVTGETRVVTVLFVDMCGPVEATRRLPPEDAAELVDRLLRAMVDAVVKYEGHIDGFLGDGFRVVFGAPVTHESDPERAIHAALEIRAAAEGLGLRATAGINTGEVYYGPVGSEAHREISVMGSVVNLAARLQGMCEPGTILVGRATHGHTRRAFEFSPREVTVKGLEEPIPAYRVERPRARPEKTRGIEGLSTELIGRDDELGRLRGALEETLQGRGRIVSLIGEAGVGKSRLVSELRRHVDAIRSSGLERGSGSAAAGEAPHADSGGSGASAWLEGRCLEMSRDTSYWPFIDLLRGFLDDRPDDGERARGERVLASLRSMVERGDLTPERADEIALFLGHLLSIRWGDDRDDRLRHASPEQIRHQLPLAIRDFFLAMARRGPVILVLEDLHWADSHSLDVLGLLMEALTLVPLLLVCVYRPEREHPCWGIRDLAARKCPDRAVEIFLKELTPPQSRRLIDSLLVIDRLPLSLKERIEERSRGNPFFVEEVIRSLIDKDLIRREDGIWRAREGIDSVAVPESIQGVIRSRLDRLDGNLRRVLQTASVIGRLFRRRLLESVTREMDRLEGSLEELEDLQLICQERSAPEEEYSFQHVLTQETVYGSLLKRKRAEFHHRVATAMEALYGEAIDEFTEQLAHHFDRSGDGEKAVEYLLKAGEKARRAYLNEEAIRFYRRVLERLEASPSGAGRDRRRLDALKGLGTAYNGMGRPKEADGCLREAGSLAREIGAPVAERVRLLYALSESLYWQGRSAEIGELGREGLALAGEGSETAEAALMNSMVAVGSQFDRKDDFIEYNLRNSRFLDRLPYAEELRPAYVHLIKACMDLRRASEGWRWIDLLTENAKAHHDLHALAESHFYAGLMLAGQGDGKEALHRQQAGLEVAETIGDVKIQNWCLLEIGLLRLGGGDAPAALEALSRAERLAEEIGMTRDMARANLRMGAVFRSLGRPEEAEAACRKAIRIQEAMGRRSWTAEPLHLLGRIALAGGDAGEAARRFGEALERLDPDFPAAPDLLPGILAGIEEAMGPGERARSIVDAWRERREWTGRLSLNQWFLEPAEPRPFRAGERINVPVTVATDGNAAGGDGATWRWIDPFGDGSFEAGDAGGGVTIRAVDGRGLNGLNAGAPRLLRAVAGEFAFECETFPGGSDRPAIGGVLLWKDESRYLLLGRGRRGAGEVALEGSAGETSGVFGRGILGSERVTLRLERAGRRVRALCKAGGGEWRLVGEVDWPAGDPAEVGMAAIGAIDRGIYPGAFPDGAALRFESPRLWTADGIDR